MSKGASSTNKQPEPDIANLSQAELASNQESTAVPWFSGERKIAVTWISTVANMTTKNAGGASKK